MTKKTFVSEHAQIHASAVVDDSATVGADTKIWHFCHVMADARVGARCVLGQNVFVASHVIIGDGCRIQNNVSLYDGVVLEEEVFVGPSCVFTNVRNPRASISRRGEYLPTTVKRGATLGANATVVAGVTIGEWAFVGAGTVVLTDVPAHALVVGNPARAIGWVDRAGERLSFENGVARCPGANEEYLLDREGQCRRRTCSTESK
jgi:UDP-2-acetamido-3-amino-2,3-dideoxy-glucuronate N-acetyltransferase